VSIYLSIEKWKGKKCLKAEKWRRKISTKKGKKKRKQVTTRFADAYVMALRATSLKGLMVLRNFDDRQVTKRRSEDLRKEFARLTYLKWTTVISCGDGDEVELAKEKVAEIQGKKLACVKKRQWKDEREKNRGCKIFRSWAMPLVGANTYIIIFTVVTYVNNCYKKENLPRSLTSSVF
jgi:hypothetical protein